ncbi:MAG: hypothetical protein ABIH26_03850 [Candidatus Eisenbacteria bacterium]
MGRSRIGRGGGKSAWGLVRVGGADRLARATRTSEGFLFSPAAERGTSGPGPGGPRPRGGPGVVALFSDLASRHERLELPPMKAAQVRRAMALRMESMAAKDDGTEAAYAPSNTEKPNDLLVVTASREAVDGKLRRLREAGHRPERLVTPSAALAGLIRAIRPAREEESATALVHFGEEVGSVAFLVGGALVLAREFRMPKPSTGWVEEVVSGREPRLDLSFRDHLIGEIGRSLLFFNTKFRGKPVGRMLLSSDLDGVEEILPACAEKFGEGTLLLIDWIELDCSGFGEGAEGRRKAGLWLGAFAAAVIGLTGAPDIDLTPASEVRGRKRGRATGLATAALLSLAAVMALGHLSHVRQVRRLAGAEENLALLTRAADDRITASREAGEARLLAAERLAFLDGARAPLRAFRGALRAVSLASTDSLVVESLSLDRPEEGPHTDLAEAAEPLRLRVRGAVSGRSGAEAQRQFDAFLKRLRENRLFREAEPRPLRMEAREDPSGSVLRFEIGVPVERQGRTS